jgi:hypothetical protein
MALSPELARSDGPPQALAGVHRATGGTMSELKPKIVLSRIDGAEWTRKGLRAFLEYRDLGLAQATEGRVGGTIGRAIKKFEPGGGAPRHTHNTSFHLIFVMRGWFRTEFEGLGEVVVRQWDCISYQGEIPQAHIEYSDDSRSCRSRARPTIAPTTSWPERRPERFATGPTGGAPAASAQLAFSRARLSR